MARCCPTDRVTAPRDHGVLGSARPFLQRIGLLRAARLPSPRLQFAGSSPHRLPLYAPWPLVELLDREAGPTPELLRDQDPAIAEEE